MKKRTKASSMLRRIAEERELTKRQIAAEVGLHETYVGRLIEEERSAGLAAAVRFRDVYGIPIEAWGEPCDETDTAGAA